MSQLLSLEAPDHARSVRLCTERGIFAALDVEPAGHALSRATALFVPGFMGSKEDFLPMLPALSDAGVRVVAVDCRGQFETGQASPDPSFSRADLASDLVAVARCVDAGPVHLLGHSYGGLVSRAAVLATQGDPALWASLTLMNFGPAGVSSWQQERLNLLLSVIDSMTLADIWPFVRSGDALVPEDVESFLERRWLSNSPSQLAAVAEHMLEETDTTSELARLSVPLSVISGTPDETWAPDGVERMARELGARFVRIEGGGHSPNVHMPAETVSALLDFWLPRQSTVAA
ncbi:MULTISPECIES: alpha/beta fold hydrolase [Streptomyces]|uniref:alpha/beta fold hydrolase n=1 Tax=Streptomyces TaxID=1883 RepID=UPI00167015D2|nr:alpha/beta hydrolase [Streptomyces atratus]MCX5345199.1 alpha/beta hydrolase [Streptomyces atratus]WPW27362.1 alpha/beta hydrolase [Streptomyces atratus]GGT51258.1 alpha/beta hydrolase [Streptomyces atratus]